MTLFMLALYFFENFITNIATRFYPFLVSKRFEVDDNIDNYWASLDERARKWSIQEEANVRQLLGGFKILTDEELEKLHLIPLTQGRFLQGVHSYDILANPLYA